MKNCCSYKKNKVMWKTIAITGEIISYEKGLKLQRKSGHMENVVITRKNTSYGKPLNLQGGNRS